MKTFTHPSVNPSVLLVVGLLAWTSSLAPAAPQPAAQAVLHQFKAGPNDGGSLYSSVIVGSDGALYGTSWSGGANAFGTVFKLNPDGSGFTILHHLGLDDDGASPFAPVVQANNGWLYGTTYWGGVSNAGVVFKLNPATLDYAVIHHFTGPPEGAHPYAGLIQGFDGALYGTTYGGGITNQGTVFKINPDGSGHTVLHSFTNNFPFSYDGQLPYGTLVQASNGMLYGTTLQGGANLLGTVFALNTNGANYSLLHHFGSFSDPTDGATPRTGLLLGRDGALYGTTLSGGTNGYGTAYRITQNGSYTTLHSFTSSPDGGNPYGGLAQASDGWLYGMTAWGGNTNRGTVFRLQTNGANFSVIHHFGGQSSDGTTPFAGFATTTNGLLYGTTLSGGTNGFGTVFRLTLRPEMNLTFQGPGSVALTLTGASGQSCAIQASTNLIHWTTLTTVTLTNGTAHWTDTGAEALPKRYYRAQPQ